MLDNLAFISNILFVLVLGVVTSYDDIKKNRISNRYVTIAVIFAFLTNILGSYFAQASADTKMLYIETTLLNAFFALLLGFIFWYAKVWRAGDGKLFFAYAFLLPISTYYYGYIPYFPSFTLLTNTLLTAFFLLTFNVWVATSTDEKLEILKKSADPKQLFYILLSLISVQWVSSALFAYLLPTTDVITTTVFSILLLFVLMNQFRELLYEASIPITILRIVLDYRTVTSYGFLAQFLPAFILFAVAFNFITELGIFRFTERIRINDLKAGMCCVEKVTRKAGLYGKTSEGGKLMLDLSYESLTDGDIKKLRKLNDTGKLKFEELTIWQTIPFAPILFLGALLTLIIHGDIVALLKLILL